jgi:predicted metal-dependent hydrolase
VEYALLRSARRRTIGLKVGPEGLSVTLPARTSARQADRVLRERADWVIEKLEKWQSRPAPRPLEGVSGETVSWLGAPRALLVLPHDRARTRIALGEDVISVFVDAGLEGDLRAATVRRALTRWRAAEALAFMAPRLAAHAAALGRPAPEVKVRAQTSRWGSCASDGVIRMNVRLMHHHADHVDFVCAHEACHLIEMNHSDRFYALLDRLMPDHRARRRAMRDAAPEGAVF